MKRPLPMLPAPITQPESLDIVPVTRQELMELVSMIGAQCKMPPSVKNAQFVRLPADLFLRVHDVVQRELATMVDSAK